MAIDAIAGDAGIVDQQSRRLRKPRDGGFHRIGIGDIDAHELMREACNILRLADVEGVDQRAGLAERVGDRPADAAAAAGNDGPMIAKIERAADRQDSI